MGEEKRRQKPGRGFQGHQKVSIENIKEFLETFKEKTKLRDNKHGESVAHQEQSWTAEGM